MKALRGATTVEKDDSAEIREMTGKLLDAVTAENNLAKDDIQCIIFSTTNDIHSMYPAKAARERGYENVALFSCAEPDIEGGLPLCIRVLVLCNGDGESVPVYQNGAKALRRDKTEKMNIAIDGPAGSGKSTMARLLADAYHILYLDTGAMYRAVALGCMRADVNVQDEEEVKKALPGIDVEVRYEDGAQSTYLNGENVNGKIRTGAVSMASSAVSQYACVRDKMVSLQRKIAADTSCVLDGRDIGTNVLPDAKYKFYLTASPEVRAERRLYEYQSKGLDERYEDILEDMKKRDGQDAARKISPLRKADDAEEIDTSDMTRDEVLGLIRSKIQEKI